MAAGFTIAASFVCYLYILFFILICVFSSFRAVCCCCCWLLLFFGWFCVCFLFVLFLGGGTFGFETLSAFSISRHPNRGWNVVFFQTTTDLSKTPRKKTEISRDTERDVTVFVLLLCSALHFYLKIIGRNSMLRGMNGSVRPDEARFKSGTSPDFLHHPPSPLIT